MNGRLDEARDLSETTFRSYGAKHPDAFPSLFAVTGQVERGRQQLRDIERNGYIERLSIGERINAYVSVGEFDQGFTMMDSALETRHVLALGIFRTMNNPDNQSVQASESLRRLVAHPEWQQRMNNIDQFVDDLLDQDG